jgi:hypothetical protein
MEVHAVAIKLPTFWVAQPAVWFRQAEAQFHLRNITTDETKYYHVVASLDQDSAQRVLSTLDNPPDAGKYEDLKRKLLHIFTLSRRQRAAKLCNVTGLGDKLPSQLLAEMLSLLGGEKPGLMFEHAFLLNMPEDLRLLITDDKFKDLDELAIFADGLYQAKQNTTTSVCTVDTVTQPANAWGANTVSTGGRRPPPVASASRRIQKTNRSNGKTTESDPQEDKGFCYFHNRFGNKANKCRTPCTWPENDLADRH